jgi:single-strand DNA-binding protein
VEGRLKNRQWQGEDGQTRYSTEIQVTDFTFLTAKPDAPDTGMSGQRPAAQVHSRPVAPQTTAPVDQEDDLPF